MQIYVINKVCVYIYTMFVIQKIQIIHKPIQDIKYAQHLKHTCHVNVYNILGLTGEEYLAKSCAFSIFIY